MNGGANGFTRKSRISGILLIIGLCIEAVSLHWIHPIAFIGFALGGGLFLLAGLLVFLYALVFESAPGTSENSNGQ